MGKIFNNVSNEMINVQLHDPITVELEQYFNILIKMSDKYSSKLVTGISFFRNKETRKIIDAIDKSISKRFGIQFKHVNATGIGYAVMPIPPINYNVIGGDIRTRFKKYKDVLGKSKCNPEFEYCNNEFTKKDVSSDIKDAWKDEKSIIYKNYIGYLELEKTLNSKGVKINLDKATVKGLPSNYEVFLLVDIFSLINTYNLTAKEMVATLLHEVGHAFTHLEYSYRTVKSTTVILDTLRSDLTNGKNMKKTLMLLYKNELGGDEKDLKDSNLTIASIRFMDKYMSNTMVMSKNDKHSGTDSEQLADQFANRFGVGSDLLNALVKLHNANGLDLNLNNDILLISILVLLSAIAVVVFLPAVITYIVTQAVMTLLFGGDDSNEITYDKNKRRYYRIRNDMVRVLRTSDLPKKDMKKVIEEINFIDKVINDTPDDTGWLEKFGNKLLPWNRRASNFKELEQYLEDLTENSLHVSSNKLKNI